MSSERGFVLLAKLLVVNNGSTPARNILVKVNLNNNDFGILGREKAASSIFPLVDIPKEGKGAVQISLYGNDESISEALFKGIPIDWGKIEAPRIFGRVEYMDVLGDQQFTEFCFKIGSNPDQDHFLIRDRYERSVAT